MSESVPGLIALIKKYLKENLEIRIVTDRQYDYYGGHSDSINVQVILEDEVISSSSDTF